MTTADPQFEGVYGTYTITEQDRREVQRYRLALLISGLSFSAGLLQWWQWGGQLAWLWVLPLAASLGLALHWIHIYLRPLHQALQLFWLLGCMGWSALLVMAGPSAALATCTAVRSGSWRWDRCSRLWQGSASRSFSAFGAQRQLG